MSTFKSDVLVVFCAGTLLCFDTMRFEIVYDEKSALLLKLKTVKIVRCMLFGKK